MYKTQIPINFLIILNSYVCYNDEIMMPLRFLYSFLIRHKALVCQKTKKQQQPKTKVFLYVTVVIYKVLSMHTMYTIHSISLAVFGHTNIAEGKKGHWKNILLLRDSMQWTFELRKRRKM